MAATAAVKARSALISATSISSSYILISKRCLSSSISITKPILRPSLYLSHSLRQLSANSAARMTSIRRRFNHSSLDYDDFPSWEAVEPFPGCDFKHHLIFIDEPGEPAQFALIYGREVNSDYLSDWSRGNNGTCEEEAKKKICSISCSEYFGFGFEIDEETSERLEGLPGVLFVLPDTYVDRENKDYGCELYVNGEIVQRSPERQMRMEAFIRRARHNPEFALMIKLGLSISEWECK